MEKNLECMMLLCFIAATGNELCRLVKNPAKDPVMERIMAIATGAGFVLGAVMHVAAVPEGFSLEAGLCILGAVLSYTAALFTIPEGKEGGFHE